jgi:hypothetical protein
MFWVILGVIVACLFWGPWASSRGAPSEGVFQLLLYGSLLGYLVVLGAFNFKPILLPFVLFLIVDIWGYHKGKFTTAFFVQSGIFLLLLWWRIKR